ncbi:MAG: TRAP transporter small permease [Alphaproteobacteria bacterium]|nr:TRAP transporter small permease [Alphaproteobacteria bacterium]
MSEARDGCRPTPPVTPIERISGVVAVLGGLLSLAIAVLVVASVLGRWLFGTPINGDFEYVKMGTAIAVYCALPYCQILRGNIVVDTFTNRLSARTNALIDAFWDIVYAGMMALLTLCLFNGTLDYIRSGETTMMTQVLVWPAIAVCMLLSALLTCAALATAVQRVREFAA